MSLLLPRGVSVLVLTLSQTTNFRLFQTERVSDDNFKFNENGRKLSRLVADAEGKGEIACYKQFLLFPQCFPKTLRAHVISSHLKYCRKRPYEKDRVMINFF